LLQLVSTEFSNLTFSTGNRSAGITWVVLVASDTNPARDFRGLNMTGHLCVVYCNFYSE
jgi:hypothetical protein